MGVKSSGFERQRRKAKETTSERLAAAKRRVRHRSQCGRRVFISNCGGVKI